MLSAPKAEALRLARELLDESSGRWIDAVLTPESVIRPLARALIESAAERTELEREYRDVHRTYPVLVVCAVIIRDGMVLLERHAPDGVNSDVYKWDIPGGKVECGEEPANAVVREIREEIGVEIRVIAAPPVIRRSVWINKRGQRDWILAPYLCEIVSGEPVETEDLKWFPLSRMSSVAVGVDADLVAEVAKLAACAKDTELLKKATELLTELFGLVKHRCPEILTSRHKTRLEQFIYSDATRNQSGERP